MDMKAFEELLGLAEMNFYLWCD